MKVFKFVVIIIIISGCSTSRKKASSGLCNTDNFQQKIEQLSFADADKLKKLNGRFIEINGIFHHYFEDSGLYPDAISHSKNALWLELILPDSSLEILNKRKVTVIGKVNISLRGHFNGYLATLDSVFCIKEIE